MPLKKERKKEGKKKKKERKKKKKKKERKVFSAVRVMDYSSLFWTSSFFVKW